MNKSTTLNIIRNLLNGFATDKGCPEAVYLATSVLIGECFGGETYQRFAWLIDAAEGSYYIPGEIPERAVESFMGYLETMPYQG